MSLRKMIVLICLLILPTLVHAKENPRIYTIQKGDTLWGISQRFISDPWYWPNLWANNPFIRNPHLIYPGQTLAIYDNRIELVPEYQKDAKTIGPSEIVETMPLPQEEITFKAYNDANSFIDDQGISNAGRIVDTVDNRIMMTQDDTVFVLMNDPYATVGAEYNIFSIGKDVTHPLTDKKLGKQITWRGKLVLTEANEEVFTANINKAVGEIVRGDILLPVPDEKLTIVLKRAEQNIDGCIIAAHPEKMAFAQYDIFYIDRGSNDGVEVGNMLTIIRHRKASEVSNKQDHNLRLPDSLLGRAVVIKTDTTIAAAVILKASQAIYRGDFVYTETN